VVEEAMAVAGVAVEIVVATAAGAEVAAIGVATVNLLTCRKLKNLAPNATRFRSLNLCGQNTKKIYSDVDDALLVFGHHWRSLDAFHDSVHILKFLDRCAVDALRD
jgi:hypothetical protein